MSGLEIVGLVATVGSLAAKSSFFINKVRSASNLSRENKPLCSALDTQLASLSTYVEEMQLLQPVELESLGPQWAAALDQLASEMVVISQKLGELTSVKSRSRGKTKVMMLKDASEVSAVLRHTETKLGIAWSRLQGLETREHIARGFSGLAGILLDHSRSLAVMERILDSNGGALSMVAIVEEENGFPAEPGGGLLPSTEPCTGSTSAASSACRTIYSPGAEEALSSTGDYEDERKKLEELHPMLGKFLRKLERGQVRAQMSKSERCDLAALLERLWMPWKLNRATVKYGPMMVGDGAYGIVFKGKLDLSLQEGKLKVAVKVMREALVRDEFRADFFREASLLYRLRHPAIVAFYGAWWPEDTLRGLNGDDDDGDEGDTAERNCSSLASDSDDDAANYSHQAMFVTELMDGHVGKLVESGKITEYEDILRICGDAVDALRYLHGRGVLHLDVKPENILARTNEGRLLGRAKLTDFGVSRRKQGTVSPRFTTSRQATSGSSSGVGAIGTPAVMAPELLLFSPTLSRDGDGAASVDGGDGQGLSQGSVGGGLSFACDVYSLGVTICRVMQLNEARAGRQISSPVPLLWSETELAAAARSGRLGADMRGWVNELLLDEAPLRELVLACVQVLPCARPAMETVQKALQEIMCVSEGCVERVRAILAAGDGNGTTDLINLGVKYWKGEGVAKDYGTAFHLFTRAADGGNMVAVNRLGLMYENGHGVAKDHDKACELYKRAADGGSLAAVNNLGLMYANGDGVSEDLVKARELFQRAADGGVVGAVNNLGWMYQYGHGVTIDLLKARELFQRAADGGSMTAVNHLGRMYQNGDGVAIDLAKARELYQQATDGGVMAAAGNLGFVYENGYGITKDLVKARELYQRATDGGQMDAATRLRDMSATGDGVPTISSSARKLFQRITR